MYGGKLEVDIHLVTGETTRLRNIATCIERSHLDIAALCLSGYAAGLACLVEDEMDLGCTVVDMGGGVTSIAVFQGGNLVFSDAIPVGGNHVTSDVAQGLTCSLADAERIKTLYGSAMASGTDESELIDVPLIGEDSLHHPHHVPRSLLVGIIQPRLEEVFELVRARLKDSGFAQAAGRRVVLTGGASQLPGLRELGQIVLDKQVRLGRPIRMDGLSDAVAGPAFATTAGLLTYISERAHEMPAEILALAEPGNIWERVRFWMRDNW
jgi:cell division protein FtsA